MPEAPPAQSRPSTVQSAMTITSMASAGIEDDEPFDQTQLTFEPEDLNYGKAVSSAKHGPYYMHMGDTVCSICFKNIATFMCCFVADINVCPASFLDLMHDAIVALAT